MALGNVRPHVRAAADEIAAKFSITEMYGVGSRPNKSDHPFGLAVDFSGLYAKQSVGDNLSAYAMANAARLSVKYVIWRQRYWEPGKSWEPMEDRGSLSANHMNHVHISFKDTPGTGGAPVEGGNVAEPVFGFTNPLQPLIDAFAGINNAAQWLSDGNNWIRIAEVVVGAILLIMAIVSWDKVKSTAVSAAKQAIPTAKEIKP